LATKGTYGSTFANVQRKGFTNGGGAVTAKLRTCNLRNYRTWVACCRSAHGAMCTAIY